MKEEYISLTLHLSERISTVIKCLLLYSTKFASDVY